MFLLLLHLAIVVPCSLHILLRKHRQPESRVAWLLLVFSFPYVGALIYLLVGRTSIGHGRIAELKQVLTLLPRPECALSTAIIRESDKNCRYTGLFSTGTSISGYLPVNGNHAKLMADSDSTIDHMITDIDCATDTVHLLFYIWLNDNNGTKMAEALKRAAARGVVCRAMVDNIGSRAFIRSHLWKELSDAGVHTLTALGHGAPWRGVFNGRIDLRNHRKILVIDNRITYCGSQNCADPAFYPKAKYGPWVDAVFRFEGPVVRQNQHLFASDWMAGGGDDLSDILRSPLPVTRPGFAAQAIGTGPTFRSSAMSEMFEALINAAQSELCITTPYYVPNPSLQAALCASANRGVATSIILPARNDDFAVQATSRSYYEELILAGVRIHEFLPGLLHTKSITLDNEISLIGSANMDRRSFDLNYENNILLHDKAITLQMRERQQYYIDNSRVITLDDVRSWSVSRRLLNNTVAIVSPLI